MAKTKIQTDLDRKTKRREQECQSLAAYGLALHQPAAAKKPQEFKFDRHDLRSFEYAIGIGNTLLEKKSDGFCVHVSIDNASPQKVRLYSSGSNEWNPACFPELRKGLDLLPSGYYHGELLGLSPDSTERFTSLDEFIAVENRPKTSAKNVTDELVSKYPLKLDIFDALRIGQKVMLSRPLSERRAALESIIEPSSNMNLIQQWSVGSPQEMQQIFSLAVINGYEGLIAKDPDSLYVPGSRDNDWLKLKNFTTLDLAVLGFYETPESVQARKPFSAVLVGSYNTDTGKYETLAKVKVGAKKDQEGIFERYQSGLVLTGGSYEGAVAANLAITLNPAMAKIDRKIPKSIVGPGMEHLAIVEIQALDITHSDNWHSCGIGYDGTKAHSLRIPTFVRMRQDKSRIEDITTTQAIHQYYVG